ncbi:MAG TPA: hypothetical protein VGB94_01805 [Acidobacteriaceae bacterium]
MNQTLRYSRNLICIAAMALTLAGCKSKEQKAIDQATQQAIATGQPQQVVTTDKNGNTTTTIVQPPAAPGQAPLVTTTTTTTQGGAPVPNEPTGTAANSAPPAGTPVVTPVSVHVSAGTKLTIRIDQHISVKTTPAGARFTGEIVEPVMDENNHLAIAKGSAVEGRVVASHKRGHFKGASILQLELTAVNINGTSYPLDTNNLTRTKKGKGKRSAAMIGGGAGAGMLIGGLATGGVGLVVGGLIGGGAGTAAAGLTGNRDIDIPAESIVSFRLADPLIIS